MLKRFEGMGILIEDVLYCPHHPEGILPKFRKNCSCRKPGTALAEEIIKKQHYQKEMVVVVGDKKSDIEMGRKLGVRTYLVETGHGMEHKQTTRADFVVKDLEEAVNSILS